MASADADEGIQRRPAEDYHENAALASQAGSGASPAAARVNQTHTTHAQEHPSAPDKLLETSARARWSFIGWALLIFAQYLMLRQVPLIPFAVTEREVFDRLLGVPNLDNVVLGIGLLVVGCYCLAHGVMPRWHKPQPILSLPFPRAVLSAGIRQMSSKLAASLLLFTFLLWQLSVKYYDSFLVAVWIGAIALLAYAAWCFDRSTGAPLSPRIERRDLAVMLAVLVLGLGVGSYRLGEVPNSLIGDEGSFWESARSIATGEYKPGIFGLGVYSYPILSSIYQSWFLKLFGLSLWSWRFASVIAVVLALPATYLFARELFGRRVATVAALVMTITPYSIAFARLGYNNAQSILPVVLALYLLYAGLGRSSALYVVLSGVVAGLGFYTYTAGRLALAVAALALACLFIALLVGRARRRDTPAGSLVGLFALGIFFSTGWLLTALPHILYASGENAEMFSLKTLESILANVHYARTIFPDDQLFRDQPAIEIGTETLFFRLDLYAYLLIRGLLRSMLVFHHAGLVSEHFIKGPLTGPWATILYTGGLAVALTQYRQKSVGLLLLWFIGGVVLLSGITTFPPRQAHLVTIIPAMAILIALGIVTLADSMSTYIQLRQPLAQGGLLVGCVLLLAYNGLSNYFVDVQTTYPPYQEHIIAFTALNLSEPRQIVYVYAESEDRDFIPWAIRHIPNRAVYSTTSLEELANVQQVLNPSQPYMLFFRPDDEPVVKAYVTEKLKGIGTFTNYYNAERQIILMSYTSA